MSQELNWSLHFIFMLLNITNIPSIWGLGLTERPDCLGLDKSALHLPYYSLFHRILVDSGIGFTIGSLIFQLNLHWNRQLCVICIPWCSGWANTVNIQQKEKRTEYRASVNGDSSPTSNVITEVMFKIRNVIMNVLSVIFRRDYLVSTHIRKSGLEWSSEWDLLDFYF